MKCIMKVGILIVLLGVFTNIGLAAEMKKVLILYTHTAESMLPESLRGLQEAGFVERDNVTTEQIAVTGVTSPSELVAQVQEAAPDVVVYLAEYGHLLAALKGLPVPVVTAALVEPHVNAEGEPAANVTGFYSVLPDMVFNSYKFFQKVAPLGPGQQVVFFENPAVPLIPKASILDALERFQIPIKAVVDITEYETWQQAVLQYNDDPEVGWILRTSGPLKKADGSPVNVLSETFVWEREHLKKPSISYWEMAVRGGTLCAFGVDLDAVAAEAGRMAARVLQGEAVNSIKAEFPNKVQISLNRKTATNLGIVFSLDVLNLASMIFDDYEGKQVIRK